MPITIKGPFRNYAGGTPVAKGTLTLALALSQPLQGRIVSSGAIAPSPVVVPLDAQGAVNFSIAGNHEIGAKHGLQRQLGRCQRQDHMGHSVESAAGGSTGAGTTLDISVLGYSLLGGPGDRLGHSRRAGCKVLRKSAYPI